MFKLGFIISDDWEKACRHVDRAEKTDNVATDDDKAKRGKRKPLRFENECDGSIDGDDECKGTLLSLANNFFIRRSGPQTTADANAFIIV